jgi:ATP-dependent helicase HrpB
MQPLPVDELIPDVLRHIARGSGLVLAAPPGSGKSTRVPPALAKQLPGKTYLLQPRRIAAKALAKRIAAEQGWRIGGEVGYRVRFERSGGDQTRLWVMTEGSLTRQLMADPYLDGVSCVILDEFHERSLHVDLALAYLREVQAVRPELKLVAMSATLAAAPLASYLGNCPVVESAGTLHAVETSHANIDQGLPLETRVARAVLEALKHPDCGDVLVFLPGTGEIRACERALEGIDADVLPLHGQLSPDEQERALEPGDRRRVVLATNVAETSLTIPGVRTVIDSGLARVLRFAPRSGVEELALEPISRQSATQRAGRAGRTAPGRCIRLWTPLADRQLPEASDPEVRRADLAPILVSLKRLGYADAARFPWFEAPEPERREAAERLLALIGAAPADGPLTPLGERLASLPLHPRLGKLLVEAAGARAPRLGATLAALISERDLRMRRPPNAPPADPAPADALERLELLGQAERLRHAGHLRSAGIDPQASAQAAKARDEILSAWQGAERGWREVGKEPEPDADLVRRLLLAAFPDRVARRSSSDANRATLVGGVTIEIDRQCALFADRGVEREPLLVAIELQRVERAGREVVVLRQGAEADEALLEAVVPGAIQRVSDLRYDAQAGRVVTAIRWMYRDLALREAAGAPPDAAQAAELLARALAPEAKALIEADEEAASWLTRARWLRMARPELGLPAFDDADLADVIVGCCAGCSARGEVLAKPKRPWLEGRLTREQALAVEEQAPAQLTVPTGNRIRLDYAEATAERPPVLAVRLQELFGQPATPRIGGGAIPVLLHLLGPNYRVEQVTRDLASFWTNTYPQVRKDLRGRYPKHSWPDDPLTAPPVAKGRPRQ